MDQWTVPGGATQVNVDRIRRAVWVLHGESNNAWVQVWRWTAMHRWTAGNAWAVLHAWAHALGPHYVLQLSSARLIVVLVPGLLGLFCLRITLLYMYCMHVRAACQLDQRMSTLYII